MRSQGVVITALFACITSSGCVSADYMPVGQETYPPRPDDWIIEVFVAIDAPVRVHQSIEHPKSTGEIPANAKVIGRVDAQGAELASWNSVIDIARKKARALGGDGLVVGSWGHSLTGVDSYGNAHHGKGLSFTVIRYRS